MGIAHLFDPSSGETKPCQSTDESLMGWDGPAEAEPWEAHGRHQTRDTQTCRGPSDHPGSPTVFSPDTGQMCW